MKFIISIFCLNIFLLCSFASRAQTNVTNTGTLYISITTDTLYISGDFTNSSAAALTNNGRLYVKQDLSNAQASMAVGTGTLYLNGSSLQSLIGTQTFKTYNLVTNNSAGFKLSNDMSVSGAHTFTSGMITTSTTPNYLIYEAGSSYSGDNDSRHINGWVKKLGNTGFTFPVGDATYERPVAISALSATSEFNCHYYTPSSNIYNLTSPIIQIKANEYWQVDKISGGTAQITLNWNHPKVAMDNILIADILPALYTGGKWTSQGTPGASGNVTTTGTVTSLAISSFGSFTLGYKSFPVPLKLISFTATRRSATSFLNWMTENEENVDRFEIERSDDAISYTTISRIPARNRGLKESYDFQDHSSVNGIAYYRIKSVDLDGKYSFSKIVAVNENDLVTATFVVLNPVRNAITVLNKTGKDGSFNYRLFDASGQLVVTGKENIGINSGAVLPLPAQVTAGIYILELSNDNIRFRQQILVQK